MQPLGIEEAIQELQNPLISPETVRKGLDLNFQGTLLGLTSRGLDSLGISNPIRPIQQGTHQVVAETISGLSSPQNLVLTGVSVSPAGPYVNGALLLYHLPEIASHLKESGELTVKGVQERDLFQMSYNGLKTALGVLSVVGGKKNVDKIQIQKRIESNSLRGFNPFKGKTPQEIDQLFRQKGFQTRGPDPVQGIGGYINPKTGRSYYINPGGEYKKAIEHPHVDVNRVKAVLSLETGEGVASGLMLKIKQPLLACSLQQTAWVFYSPAKNVAFPR